MLTRDRRTGCDRTCGSIHGYWEPPGHLLAERRRCPARPAMDSDMPSELHATLRHATICVFLRAPMSRPLDTVSCNAVLRPLLASVACHVAVHLQRADIAGFGQACPGGPVSVNGIPHVRSHPFDDHVNNAAAPASMHSIPAVLITGDQITVNLRRRNCTGFVAQSGGRHSPSTRAACDNIGWPAAAIGQTGLPRHGDGQHDFRDGRIDHSRSDGNSALDGRGGRPTMAACSFSDNTQYQNADHGHYCGRQRHALWASRRDSQITFKWRICADAGVPGNRSAAFAEAGGVTRSPPGATVTTTGAPIGSHVDR